MSDTAALSTPPADPAFPALAEPLAVGSRIMRNRIVQAPLSVCYQDEQGAITDRTIAHYRRRARGGVGMVITENFAVDEGGRQLPRHGLIADDSHLAGLTRLADAIKAEGALAVLQLVHAGRYAGPWQAYEARRRLAPSAVAFELMAGRVVTPAEITEVEIVAVIDAFARATSLARQAGFDGVQLHGAQGFLLCEFQSPRMNHRTDGYGGDFAARCRFPLEVVDAVVAATGGEMIVGYHLLSDEMMPGGWSPSEAARFAGDLAQHGVDFISPSATTFESLRAQLAIDPTVSPVQYQPATVAGIVASTSLPIFANGGLSDPARAQEIVSSGAAAAVMLGRALLTDPDWVAKTLTGRSADVVRCGCQPPTCLGSQFTGVICHSWSDSDVARGYVG